MHAEEATQVSESSKPRLSLALGLLAIGTLILASWTVVLFLFVRFSNSHPLEGYWLLFVGGAGLIALLVAIPIGSGFIVAGWAARTRSFQVRWFLLGVVVGIGAFILVSVATVFPSPVTYTTIFRWMSVAFSVMFVAGVGFVAASIGARRGGDVRSWLLRGLAAGALILAVLVIVGAVPFPHVATTGFCNCTGCWVDGVLDPSLGCQL